MNTLDARLLAALRAAPVHLAAEDLADHLGAPAAVIRARLAELNTAGFQIEEDPALGFRLLATPDRLIGDDIFARLGPVALVREIVVYEETASTNDLALQRGRQGAEGGLAIFAERQHAGRGRFGRRWESASHLGLWFSLLLRPTFPVAHWPRLTTWAAVSIAEAIESTSKLRAEIKWPNDVQLQGRKVAGVLIEQGRNLAGESFAVLGIGVNVNQTAADFPPALAEKAASLRASVGRCFDRGGFAATVLRRLDALFPLLPARFEEILAGAEARSVVLGKWVQLRRGESLSEGMAESLDENGHLLLRNASGTLERLSAGEVTLSPR